MTYDGIPECLKRDANNRAPWMRRCVSCGKAHDLFEWCAEAHNAEAGISPASNPPATPPDWVPPWAAKS